MIDIIEAGKFYNDCLKAVQEQLVKDEVVLDSLFNDVIKCKAKLFKDSTYCNGFRLVFSFVLNGTTISDSVFLEDADRNPSVIVKCVSNRISKIITKLLLNKLETDNG